MVHIYYGDGKGKTSAANGLVIRNIGYNKKALICRFLKSDLSGEDEFLKGLKEVTIIEMPKKIKFVFEMTDAERIECKNLCKEMLKQTFEAANKYDIIVLDEVLGAIETGMISEDQLIKCLKNQWEIVLTGRKVSPKLIEIADYVSEIKKIKHPYDIGVLARAGIEF